MPDILCLICCPTVVFSRAATLIWTCAISFDVYMSLNRRKWFWKGEENRWNAYRQVYVIIVVALAAPATIASMVQQHSGSAELGCSAGYKSLGWYTVFFTFNVVIYAMVRERMRLKAFPQSVRKRRGHIHYYYIIACIFAGHPPLFSTSSNCSPSWGRGLCICRGFSIFLFLVLRILI